MENCFANCKPRRLVSSVAGVLKEQDQFLRIVKMDGKVLTFRKPMIVKDILVNFSCCAVGISKQASRHLPPNYELKIGKVYYLLPCKSLNGTGEITCVPDKEETGDIIKRVKIVITKQQLQELLNKQVSVEEVLSGLRRRKVYLADSSVNWKPKLESIPEGYELAL